MRASNTRGLLLWALLLVVPALPRVAEAQRKVDFGDTKVEGEREGPSGEFVTGKQRAKFPCDIRQLSVEQYEACFARNMGAVCGVQIMERERFDFAKVSSAVNQSAKARTVGSDYPYSVQVDDGAIYVQWANEFDGWGERVAVLKDQSPKLENLDTFVATPTAFIAGDRGSKRVFVISRTGVTSGKKNFRKVELSESSHVLLGVLSSERYVVSTRRDVLLMNLDGRAGVRLKIPVDDYAIDPNLDRSGRLLLASRSNGGRVFVVDSKGRITTSFETEPGYSYHLLPTGLVAAANPSQGAIQIRGRTGLVLSRTKLGKPFHQFGVFRTKKAADLFYVNEEGVGVLYGDGFEKSFLSLNGARARVVQAEGGVLGVMTGAPSRTDASRFVEKRLDFYNLRASSSQVSKVVEGICPNAITLAEKALELKPSLKATMKDGRFNTYGGRRKKR